MYWNLQFRWRSGMHLLGSFLQGFRTILGPQKGTLIHRTTHIFPTPTHMTVLKGDTESPNVLKPCVCNAKMAVVPGDQPK